MLEFYFVRVPPRQVIDLVKIKEVKWLKLYYLRKWCFTLRPNKTMLRIFHLRSWLIGGMSMVLEGGMRWSGGWIPVWNSKEVMLQGLEREWNKILSMLTDYSNKVNAFYSRHEGEINVIDVAWCYSCSPNPKAATVCYPPLETGQIFIVSKEDKQAISKVKTDAS
jgi:hypothetical protein